MKSFRYSVSKFNHKPKGDEFKGQKWLRHTNNSRYDDLWFYMRGHAIAYDLNDYKNGKVDEVFVDIDDIDPKLREELVYRTNPFVLMDILDKCREKGFDIDRCVIVPSASNTKSKCKGFVYLKKEISQPQIQQIYGIFNEVLGIKVDNHNETLTQVTFGSLQDEDYISNAIRQNHIPQIDAYEEECRKNDTPSYQPKIIKNCSSKTKATRKKIANPTNCKYTLKNLSNIEFINRIPLNSYQKRLAIGRNTIYKEPRFDWDSNMYRKVLYGSSYKTEISPITIRKGQRHMSVLRLARNLTGQALVMEKWHNWNYSVQDIVDNVALVVTKNFEQGYNFLNEPNEFKNICDIVEDFYGKYKNYNTEAFNKAYDGICKDLLNDKKPQRVYIPRCLSVKNTFSRHHDEFVGLNYESAEKLCLKLTHKNEGRAKSMMKLVKKDFNISKSISKHQQYLDTCKTANGFKIVDRKHMQNKNFKEYCKSMNIKISSSIKHINVKPIDLNSTINYPLPPSNPSNNCIVFQKDNISNCGIPLWENDYPTESGIDGFEDENPLENEELDE